MSARKYFKRFQPILDTNTTSITKLGSCLTFYRTLPIFYLIAKQIRAVLNIMCDLNLSIRIKFSVYM